MSYVTLTVPRDEFSRTRSPSRNRSLKHKSMALLPPTRSTGSLKALAERFVIPMATAKSHLLALPRKIRDQIYGYLHNKRSFKWGDWNNTKAFNYGLFTIVFASQSDPIYSVSHVLWEEFPLHDLLLTHSRLRDEYLASPCFTNICITIRANFWSGYLLTQKDFSAKKHSIATEAILRAHQSTIYFKGERDDGPNGKQWDRVFPFVKAITSMASNMQTLSIAIMIGDGDTILRNSIAMSEQGDVNISKIDVSTPAPPDTLFGLSLLQTGKGHRIGHYHTRWSDDQLYDESIEDEAETKEESDNGPESALENGDEPEDGTETSSLLHLCHSIQTLRTYVYTRNATKRYDWDPAQLIEEWPMKGYPARVLGAFPTEKAEKLARYPNEVLNWTETRYTV
jgi:hypothetical protein